MPRSALLTLATVTWPHFCKIPVGALLPSANVDVLCRSRKVFIKSLTINPKEPRDRAFLHSVLQMQRNAFALSIDGCCDHTNTIADEELLDYYTQLMRDVDLQVFGRETYQLMVPYWPEVAKNQSETKASIEFARTFDSINKIVFSRSLDSAEEKNTRIVRGNLHDEILKLKQERGQKYFGPRRGYFFTTYRAWSSG